MTPQSIITTARTILNDVNSSIYRQSDQELLNYVNEGLQEIAGLRKELFQKTIDFTCIAGKTEQVLSFADAQELVDVIRIKDGKSIHVMDLMAMNRFNPTWSSDDAAPVQNWVRYAGDPLRFYIYPKAPAAQVIEVLCIKNANTYALNDSITDLPLSLAPSLANYVIYRAESKDDEHVNSGRAASYYTLFNKALGIG